MNSYLVKAVLRNGKTMFFTRKANNKMQARKIGGDVRIKHIISVEKVLLAA